MKRARPIATPPSDATRPSRTAQKPRASTRRQDPPVYTVEALLEARTVRGASQYLIKWKGFDSSHNSWEPEENILDRRLVAAFHRGAAKQRHVVERLLRKRRRGAAVEYLVKWEGYDETHNSWEPRRNIDAACIQEYEAAQKAAEPTGEEAVVEEGDADAAMRSSVSERAGVEAAEAPRAVKARDTAAASENSCPAKHEGTHGTASTAPSPASALATGRLPRLPRFTRKNEPHDLFSNFLMAVMASPPGSALHQMLPTLISGLEGLHADNHQTQRRALCDIFSRWTASTETPSELMDELAKGAQGKIFRADNMWAGAPEWSPSHVAAMGMVSPEVQSCDLSSKLTLGDLELCSLILLAGDYGHFWNVCRSCSSWLEVDVARRGPHQPITEDAAQSLVRQSIGIWVIYCRL